MTMSINGTNGLTFNDASTQNTAATGFGFKNRIINGAMVIDQRNAGASFTATAASPYSLDRWQVYSNPTAKFSIQQNAGGVTPPAGFSIYAGITSLSAYSVNTPDSMLLTQVIEGYNTADLAWGTANAATITLSFKVYSSLTGTFGGSLQNYQNTRSYPFTYSIPVANTWTTISVTIPGDTSGTWSTNNTGSILVNFGLGVGTTRSGTAGAWAAGIYYSATGAVSVVGTSGATFYITGVQLEKGSTATTFDYRPYGTELALCQRYYAKLTNDGTGSNIAAGSGLQSSTVSAWFYIKYPVTMRVGPTATISNTQVTNFRSFSVDATLVSIDAGYDFASVRCSMTASGAIDLPVLLQIKNTLVGFIALSSEL